MGVKDAALKRLRKTPKVFQSSHEQHLLRRELRANLLPSIVRTPMECARGGGVQSEVTTEDVEGHHFSAYKDTLEQRERVEAESATFMDRDVALMPTESDPQWLAASRCSVFRDLVADGCKNDRLRKFRRPQEGLVNIASGLPFNHPDKGFDLAELSSILTLDIERRSDLRSAGQLTPLSLQFASRVPLLVRNPLEHAGVVHRGELLPGNDLYRLRVDMRPGDVRQVAYDLGNADFMDGPLAGRMIALVNPERSALANMVRMLQAKESEARPHFGALNDILRTQGTDLPVSAPPELPEEGEDPSEGAAARLEALAAEPRRSLARFVDTMEELAQLVQPLLPSVGHAFDRAAMVCVREADRLLTRCAAETERLRGLWCASEKHRLQLLGAIERLGGQASSQKGAEQRMVELRSTLNRQEEEYAVLLSESEKQRALLEEGALAMRASEEKVAQLKASVLKLQQENLSLRSSMERMRKQQPAEQLADAHTSPDEATVVASKEAESSTDSHPAATAAPAQQAPVPEGSKESTASSKAPSKEAATSTKAESPSQTASSRLPPSLIYSQMRGVQTEENFFFREHSPLPEEMSRPEFERLLAMGDRIYRVLSSYVWNPATNTFLLSTPDPSIWAEEFAVEAQVKAAIKTLQGSVGKQLQGFMKLGFLHGAKVRVERICHEANVVQLEDEVGQLQKATKGAFENWLVSALRDAGGSQAEGSKVDPAKLWTAVTEMVETHGMRERIHELESSLSEMVPSEGKGGEAAGMDGVFWRRIIRAAQQEKEPGKAKRQRTKAVAKAAGVAALGPVMEQEVLLVEIQNIWASLASFDEGAPARFAKSSSEQMLQACIKRYYLTKTGRSKHVESASVQLCRAVLEYLPKSQVISLFGVFSGMKSAQSMTEQSVPQQKHVVRWESNFKLDPGALNDVPLDAAHCLASVGREVEVARRALEPAKDVEGSGGVVSLQVAIAAALNSVAGRSQATAKFFWAALFSLCDFKIGADGPKAAPSPQGSDSPKGKEAGTSGIELETVTAQKEAVFVSHLLATFLREQAEGDGEEEHRDVLAQIWEKVLRANPTADTADQVRVDLLGGAAAAGGAAAGVAGQVISDAAEMSISPDLVASALATVAAGPASGPATEQGDDEADAGSRRQSASETWVSLQDLEKLAFLWKQASPVSCQEVTLQWAAAWSLARERTHEMDLMGQLFQLYDASGDGWLQYDEFAALLSAMTPHVSQADTEELFLSGADDSGDMTKEVFLGVATRFGISADVDLLEHLVSSKSADQSAQDKFVGHVLGES